MGMHYWWLAGSSTAGAKHRQRRATVELWNRPKCEAGSQRLAVIADRISLRIHYAANLESTVELVLRIGHPKRSLINSQRILRIVEKRYSGSVITEWMIEDVEDDTDSGLTTIFARDLGVILAEVGPIYEIASTALPNYEFNPVEQTTAEIWDDIVQPFLDSKGLTWIDRGTFEVTEKLGQFPISRQTPLQVAHGLRQH